MEDKNVIYGLYCACESCPGEVIRYVGQTRVGMKARFREHRKLSQRSSDLPISRWKNKHGIDNIHYKVLEVLDSPDRLDAQEEEWIKRFETFTDWKKGGLNFTLGGQGWGRLASDAIEKIREANSRDDVSWAKVGRERAGEIRSRYLRGELTKDLAAEYGITQGHINSVLNNTVWIDPDYTYERVPPKPISDEDRKSHVLSRDEAQSMRDLYQGSDDTYAEIAEKFGVSNSVVSKVLGNRVYYDPNYSPGREYTQRHRDNISKSSRGKKKPEGHGAKVAAAVRGQNHGMAKLDESKVIEIRTLKRAGRTTKELSEMFQVKATQINRICNGTRWGHVKEGL